jgi:adenosylmethionine-8-amino-7-oxononanoate aminotransferase
MGSESIDASGREWCHTDMLPTQLEFVQGNGSKEPFPGAAKVSAKIHTMALHEPYSICFLAASGTMKGRGDYIALTPPFNVTEKEIETMVDRTAQVVNDFFARPVLAQ